MRVTPKISDRPAPTRNSDDAPASPLSNWTTKPETSIGGPWCACAGRSGRRAQLLHHLVGRLDLPAVDVAVVDHGAGAVAVGRLADERAHGGLVIERAVGDLAEGRH